MSMQRESSIGSVLPMTYRGHDETFARHLECRLKSLGNEISTDKTTENSSKTSNSNEVFYEYSINSPESPVEDHIDGSHVQSFITNETDSLPESPESCNCIALNEINCHSNSPHICINDDAETSDSSEYYDPENLDIELLNSIATNNQNVNLTEDIINNHLDVNNKLNSTEVPCSEIQINGKSDATNGENFCNSLNITKHMTIECTPKLEITSSENNKNGTATLNNTVSININDVDEDEETRIPRVRRCSSLKTGKTPPGTPGQKKIVRFADVLGLDLADVRTYLDEIPKIPTSAYEDLNVVDINSDLENELNSLNSQIESMYIRQKPDKVLVPLFQQPGGETDFIERVRKRQCCLENACVQDNVTLSIAGTVRVRNIDFNKSVHIRYTLDSWKTYADLQATYVKNSCDGFSDKFSFLLYCHTLDVGQRIEFAIRYQTSDIEFWDNNVGKNYCFQCLPAINNTSFLPINSPEEHWGNSSFY